MASVSAAAAGPYRVVLLTSLTFPEPGFMLVRGGGMGNRHEIRFAKGRRRKANSSPAIAREGGAFVTASIKVPRGRKVVVIPGWTNKGMALFARTVIGRAIVGLSVPKPS